MKIGRNDPCPCGSGKKYKKCCINAVSPIKTNGRFFYSDLDNLSNQVPSLIKQEKYDEAEDVCQRLLKEYPEQIDGLHRFAQVLEAKGEFRQAAEYYLKSAEFAKQADGFEQVSIDNFTKKAEELDPSRKASAEWPNLDFAREKMEADAKSVGFLAINPVIMLVRANFGRTAAGYP